MSVELPTEQLSFTSRTLRCHAFDRMSWQLDFFKQPSSFRSYFLRYIRFFFFQIMTNLLKFVFIGVTFIVSAHGASVACGNLSLADSYLGASCGFVSKKLA